MGGYFVIHVSLLRKVSIYTLLFKLFMILKCFFITRMSWNSAVLPLVSLGLSDKHGLGNLGTLLLHHFIVVVEFRLVHFASVFVFKRIVLRYQGDVAHWLAYWLLLLFWWALFVRWDVLLHLTAVLGRVVVAYFCGLRQRSLLNLVLLNNVKLGLLVVSTSPFEGLRPMRLLWLAHLIVKWSILASISRSLTDRIDLPHLNHWLLDLN